MQIGRGTSCVDPWHACFESNLLVSHKPALYTAVDQREDRQEVLMLSSMIFDG